MTAVSKFTWGFCLLVVLALLTLIYFKGCHPVSNPVVSQANVIDSMIKVTADSVKKANAFKIDSVGTLAATYYERAQTFEKQLEVAGGTLKITKNASILLADSVRYWKSVGNALKASTACDSLASEVFVLTAAEDYWHAMADSGIVNLEKVKKEQDVKFAQQKSDYVAMQRLLSQSQASNKTLQNALKPTGKWYAGGMIGAGPNNAGLGINLSYIDKQEKIIEAGSIFNTTGNTFYYIGVKVKITPPSLKSIL